ncbi:MAG TPA: IS66 family insertion sequence element accessory protein TnpB [Myxococcales bacterium LLY-WYZ-16_1]|nr:IS66 family insertion sequence element accessory protein TnpB [Myxococcales bacterium LLY-WYZ-16_1]
MLLLPRSTKIYMGRAPVNMSKSFNGLTNEVREVLRKDPLSGHLFLFFNRRRTMVKLILWTRGGFTIVAKRLERGTFSLPKSGDGGCVELDIHELAFLVEGVSWERRRMSPRWEPSQHRRAV